MNFGKYILSSINLYFGKVDEGYKYIKKEINWKEAFFISYVLIVLGDIITTIMIQFTSGYQTINNMYGDYYILISILASIILTPLLLFISSGLLHLGFKVIDGKNKYTETMKYVFSLNIFMSIISLIFSFFPIDIMQKTDYSRILYSIILGIIALILLIWYLIVGCSIFSKVHKISKGAAFGGYLLSLLFILGIFLVLGIFFGIIISIFMPFNM